MRPRWFIPATVLAAGLAVGGGGGGYIGSHTTTTPTSTPTVGTGNVILADVPGSVDPRVTQSNIASTVCKSGYTATVRPPVSYTNALKVKLLRSHGYPLPASAYELDHEISLEIGGNPTDPNNLWLEPYPLARTRDQDEDRLHRAVCAGTITLTAAQAEIVHLKHTEG